MYSGKDPENKIVDDVDIAKLEILEDGDGRHYSWNPVLLVKRRGSMQKTTMKLLR